MKSYAFLLAMSLWAVTAYAGDACVAAAACDPGCGPACEKQCYDARCCPKCGNKLCCKVVCDVREVKKTVFEVKCEPFCPALPRLCHDGCNKCCGDCGCADGEQPGCCDCTTGKCKNCCDPCAVEKAKCQVPPRCGKVCVKKTLTCKDVTCKVPTYKCIPVCPCCGHGDPCAKGGDCGSGSPAPVDNAAPSPTPAPAPVPKTTQVAPLPPALGSYYER